MAQTLSLPLVAEVHEPLSLRDYQQECLDALVRYRRTPTEAYPHGGQRALITMATGTGKTVIFAQLPRLARKRVLMVAHREELLEQAREHFLRADPLVDVGVEQAERHAPDGCKVLIASVQTFATTPRRLEAIIPDEFSVVVVDEAHHTPARSYLQVLHHFGLVPDVDDLPLGGLAQRQVSLEVRRRFEQFRPEQDTPFLVGVTATPNRTDKRGLEYIYDDIVFNRSIGDMIEAGWLCPIRGERITTATDITSVRTYHGDFAERELSEAVNTEERNALAVGAYRDHAQGRQALVFCVDVQHTRDMLSAFRSAGISAEMIVGSTPALEREAAIAAYRAGQVNVLVNCMVLTEGFDAPETSAILMARPTRSPLLYTQAIGRGTRIAPGKADLVVLDLVDVSRKAGIATLNTMFGLPPRINLGGMDVTTARRALDEMEMQVPMEQLLEATSLEDVQRIAEEFDVLSAPGVEPWVEEATAFRWVKTSFGYALSLMGEGQLGIVTDLLEHAELRFKMRGQQAERIGYYSGFHAVRDALAEGERWVERYRPQLEGVVSRRARWLGQPATPKQLEHLRRLGLPVPPSLTKGQASAMLSRAWSSKR